MKNYFYILTLILICQLPGPGVSHGQDDINEKPDIQSIINKVDRLYRSDFSRGEIEMHVVSTHWERTLSMKIWTEGMDKTFISITNPKKDAGIATLRLKTEMWNYFPRINKVMKVPPSMMMGSWMGSDFTNDDLVKESSLIDDYDYRLLSSSEDEEDFYSIELTPKIETPTVWGKILLTIRKIDYIPLTHEYYDEKGQKMRELIFSEVTQFGDRTLPAVLEMIPLNKPGQKTVVRYKNIVFDEQLKDNVFTLRNLQKKR